ncbi:MAG: radical SAM protein [Candidatus Binatus sp.]|uniref:radical SAM protein n=1 Tax=Candidatus Binatus sp. TaxID=2811406 RepID=UPI00272237B6|nr:radical SAM protein [Candidatus Binatus sp.]MDO8432609.1 radical SAM protein [Candidatus Binatus sp.]
MGVDRQFLLTGAKRVLDSRPMYAQVVVTDDCNLTCDYCDEYTPGGPTVPLPDLKTRIDDLDQLGVLVYDLLGGEPLMHPGLPELIAHIKTKRGGSNVTTVITNGFFLTERVIERLNDSGLDFMQLSVDSIEPTPRSVKSLKSLMPRMKLLAAHARFQVEVQTVLNEETLPDYDRFRDHLKEFPFAFGFSIMHGRGGRLAIRGEKFLSILRRYGVFEGMNFYGEHLQEMLLGDFSRKWKCLAGFKFLYVNSKGSVQWCAQQRDYSFPLAELDLAELRRNNRHKPCEEGCCLGCVRMISHSLGEPFKSLRSSISLATGIGRSTRNGRRPVAAHQQP